MSFFKHEIIANSSGDTLVLYIDPIHTEFADEFDKSNEQTASLQKAVQAYIKKYLPKGKIKIAEVMIGTMLVASFPIPTQVEAANFNMSYLYFGKTEKQIEFVDRTHGSVQVVAPSYFDLYEDGSLKQANQFSSTFIAEMHQRNIKVVPFLSNHWDRTIGRAALANREQLSNEIAAMVKQYKLDGVNVDIENVTHVDRDDYTDFVRLLREKLPPEKEVSVAVANNPYSWPDGWHGSYDYQALAQYADYLMVMAYDESYYGSAPGPIASIGWVEKGIQKILTDVPPEKVVVGIPFFGRYWNDQDEKGGRALFKSQVDILVERYNGTVSFDERSQSPVAHFSINENDPLTTINGRVLTNGNYTVWFENQQSIQRKIDLVHMYDLKGTGNWALGQENPVIWNDYQQWLIGVPFRDIATHWARTDIKAVFHKGWIKGVKEDQFLPNQSLTRSQAAVILARALQLQPSAKENKQSFIDINDHWAKHEIELVADHQLMVGKTANTFAPNDAVTREQVSVILDRVLTERHAATPYEYSPPFEDVESDRWSYPQIARMYGNGMVKGMGNNLFKPKEAVTRAQMATFMNRISPHIESTK